MLAGRGRGRLAVLDKLLVGRRREGLRKGRARVRAGLALLLLLMVLLLLLLLVLLERSGFTGSAVDAEAWWYGGKGGGGALTSGLVKLGLRQASGLHHGASGGLGGGAWHARRKGARIAIGKLLVGEGRGGLLLL